MVTEVLPLWLPSAIGDSPKSGGRTCICLVSFFAQSAVACGLNKALLFRNPRRAPAASCSICVQNGALYCMMLHQQA